MLVMKFSFSIFYLLQDSDDLVNLMPETVPQIKMGCIKHPQMVGLSLNLPEM